MQRGHLLPRPFVNAAPAQQGITRGRVRTKPLWVPLPGSMLLACLDVIEPCAMHLCLWVAGHPWCHRGCRLSSSTVGQLGHGLLLEALMAPVLVTPYASAPAGGVVVGKYTHVHDDVAC